MKEALDRLIAEFVKNTGGHDPVVIIIHAQTWDDIIEEIAILYPRHEMRIEEDPLLQDNGGQDGFWYRNIRVYRSNDVNEGLFKLY